jgi:hypothetical protein
MRDIAPVGGLRRFSYVRYPISPRAWFVLHFRRGWIGVSKMRRSNAPRSIGIARRSDDVQPTAILGAMGVIATLMLLWAGIAASLPA